MHRALLGLAAAAATSSTPPAQGQSLGEASFSASSGMQQVRFVSELPVGRTGDRFGGAHMRHIHVGGGVVAAGYGYSGYNDYGDFDGNRSFDPDKWNDWWHDRPNRAYPRWLSRNADCARHWYSGDVLTC
jgi:hypothetical protein